ncbi:hypothetical protein [Prosthecomicrobium sp. N25]|uniref:hypothetical protein n=1 Tax=Prosthecomicrobium sp. N25 TaxID=3129254 RepID=UPI00307843CD
MSKPLIVIEGDSWERLPNFGAKSLPIVGGTGYDLGRGLEDLGYPVENIAYWGDTIAEIWRIKDYRRALRDTGAKHFLLGGGGNDLLGEGRLQTFLRLYEKGRKTEDYFKPGFYKALDDVMDTYKLILHDVYDRPEFRDVTVIVHGYDYAKPMKLGWIGEPMAMQGIDEYHPKLQDALVKYMIDHFNERLADLRRYWPKLVHVDFRGMVKGRWHDELHPRKEAFVDLALHLSQSI